MDERLGSAADAAASDATVTMVVGPPPDVTPEPPEPPVDGRGRRRRWWAVVAILAVATAGAVVLARSSPRPDVDVRDWFDDQWVDAPQAPGHPLAEHWSTILPTDRELVGMAVVDDTVFVASRDRARSATSQVLVQAFAATDGTLRWRRPVDGPDTAVVVADGDTTTLLGVNSGGQPGIVGRYTWNRDAVAVLDPTTGTMQARRDLPEEGALQVGRNGRLLVDDQKQITVIDPLTGDVRLAFDHVTTTVGNESWRRGAWPVGDTWVVPTPDGWELTDESGRIEFTLDGITWPTVTRDVVVQADGSVLTARGRPDGATLWQVEVDGEIVGIEAMEPAPGETTATPSTFRLYVDQDIDEELGSSRMPDDVLLVEDGELVGPADEDSPSLGSDPWAGQDITVDGRPLTVCRPLPPDVISDDSVPCPAELAVLDEDGEPIATTAAPEPVADQHPQQTWRATDVGLVNVEREHVRLYRWDDLSEAWSIEVGGPWLSSPTVITTASGVAVATPESDPPRVTWYG